MNPRQESSSSLNGDQMKSYEEILKEGMEKLPKHTTSDVRFEVPKPQISISGSQTFISNFIEIANTIRRDPKHLAKYLSRELAIPTGIEGNRLVLQGKVYHNLIEKKIESYLKEYVYCNECGKPDTHLVRHERIQLLKCEACGAKQPVKSFK